MRDKSRLAFSNLDGASKAEPGIFEMLCFFAAVRYDKNLALVEGSVEILPSKKIEKQNEVGAKFTDNKDTKLIKKREQDLIENLHYVLKTKS